MSPWLGISIILIILVGLMSGLRWYKCKFSPHPELVRKLLHIGMGLTTLSLPWLFDSVWPILLLAGITIPGLYALRRFEHMKRRFGGVIDSVEREGASPGEIYFPIGVAILFILSQGEPLLYSIPILLLALADAVAALIGVRYGLTHYTTAEGVKSAEGSTAFFIVAFFSAHIPLLFFSDIGRAEALLVALILGFLMMLIEAIAWRGLDNLFIPIIGFLLLKAFLGMTAADLITRLLLTILLVVFVLVWRRRINLNDDALLGAALVGYLSWTLGDWRWFIGPFIVFAHHILLFSRHNLRFYHPFKQLLSKKLAWDVERRALKKDPLHATPHECGLFHLPDKQKLSQHYTIHAILSVGSGGLLWLFLYRLLDRPELFYLFTLAFAAQLAILAIVALKHSRPHLSALSLLGIGITRGWVLLFVPFVLFGGVTPARITYALVAILGIALAALIFYYIQPITDHYPTDPLRWLRQATCATLGSVVGLMALYLV